MLSGRSLHALGFLVGRDITYFRPAHYVLILFPSIKELTTLFLASVRVVRQDSSIPDESRREILDLTKYIWDRVSDDHLARLASAVEQFEKEGTGADLVGWARSIEVAAGRAGLLLCGDIATANEVLASDDRSVGNLNSRDRVQDLIPFSVSKAYADLRNMLGIAVG